MAARPGELVFASAGARPPAGGVEDSDHHPLGEILPFQLLSVLLAPRLGYQPGAFRQIGKVTTTL